MSTAMLPTSTIHTGNCNIHFEAISYACDTKVEFMKDDPKRSRPDCQWDVNNSNLNRTCTEWCQHAKACMEDLQKALKMDNRGCYALTNPMAVARLTRSTMLSTPNFCMM